MNLPINKILCGDSLEVIKTFSDESIDCAITSPPYWGLRDYGVVGQLGLEKTPEEYVAKLTEIFREVRRVLKKEGTCWLNLGDTYSAQRWTGNGKGQPMNKMRDGYRDINPEKRSELPNKNLVGIPWRVAFALQASGWYLRQDIIWHKPNPMPESVSDRCTKAHEYIFLLTKSPKYFFDNEAIKEPAIYGGTEEIKNRAKEDQKSAPTTMKNGIRPRDPRAGKGRIAYGGKRNGEKGKGQESFVSIPGMRNKRSVWTIATKPYAGAHFATFPSDLIIPMVKAGCPEFICKECGKARNKIFETKTNYTPVSSTTEKGIARKNGSGIYRANSKETGGMPISHKIENGFTNCGCSAGFENGVVLDPFMGSGTTAVVARNLGRNYIGIELNPEYIKLAEKRLAQQKLL